MNFVQLKPNMIAICFVIMDKQRSMAFNGGSEHEWPPNEEHAPTHTTLETVLRVRDEEHVDKVGESWRHLRGGSLAEASYDKHGVLGIVFWKRGFDITELSWKLFLTPAWNRCIVRQYGKWSV